MSELQGEKDHPGIGLGHGNDMFITQYIMVGSQAYMLHWKIEIKAENIYLGIMLRPIMLLIGNQPIRRGPFMSTVVIDIRVKLFYVSNLLHLGFQLYNSFASQHEASAGGLIPYPIQ